MRMLTLALVQILFVNMATAQPLPTPTELFDKIEQGYDQLDKAERSLSSYQCTRGLEIRGKSQGKPIRQVTKSQYTIHRDDDRLRLQYQRMQNDVKGQPKKVIHRSIFNDDYTFTVSRPEHDTNWDLDSFIREATIDTFYTNVLRVDYAVFHPLTHESFTKDIRTVLSDSTFEFQNITRNANGLLTAQFSVQNSHKGVVSASGTLIFDPAHAYIIVGSNVTAQYDSGLVSTITSERVMESDSNLLQCKSYQWKLTHPQRIGTAQSKEGFLHQITRYTFSNYDDEPVMDEEFTVEYYSIPEPTDMDALPPSLYQRWKFWAIIGAICFVGSLLGLYFLRRTSKGFSS